MSESLGWPAIVGALVGAYAAGLGTISLVLRLREGKRQVKVALSEAIMGPVSPADEAGPVYTLTAVNSGSRPVTLTSVGVLLPSTKEQIFFLHLYRDMGIPRELGEGATCTGHIRVSALAKTLADHNLSGKVEIVGAVKDSLGKEYRSRPRVADVQALTELAGLAREE